MIGWFKKCLQSLQKLFRKPIIQPQSNPESNPESNPQSNPELEVIEELTCLEIINWESSTPTYGPYHWWPWKEKKTFKSQKINNLYAKNGPIDKYDYLFASKGVEYQKKHYYRRYMSTKKDANWAGFCDKASILSCLWEYPNISVNVMYNNKSITFTKSDIEGLMIIATNNTITKRHSFYGERYDDYVGDDQSEPYPLKLLHILNILTSEQTPFCVDISNDSSVWNYPISKVIVTKYKELAEECNIHTLNIPSGGKTDYYEFTLSSNAYPSKTQYFWGWVNNTNNTITEGWLSKHTPDFLWKVYKNNNQWGGSSSINPEISCNFVYTLYQASINNQKELEL